MKRNENNKVGLIIRWEQPCSFLKTMETSKENVRDTRAMVDGINLLHQFSLSALPLYVPCVASDSSSDFVSFLLFFSFFFFLNLKTSRQGDLAEYYRRFSDNRTTKPPYCLRQDQSGIFNDVAEHAHHWCFVRPGSKKIGRVFYKSGLRDFRLKSTSFRRILRFVIFDFNIVLSMKEISEESGLSPAISRWEI